jgi:hypothetical protein
VGYGKSAFVTKPACEGEYEIPARTIADENDFALGASIFFVFSDDVCVDGSCILDHGWEWGVLE